jgi:hypothetical protein
MDMQMGDFVRQEDHKLVRKNFSHVIDFGSHQVAGLHHDHGFDANPLAAVISPDDDTTLLTMSNSGHDLLFRSTVLFTSPMQS